MTLSASRWLAALCVCGVAGCANMEGYYPQSSVTGEANIYPSAYRAETLAFLRTYLNDPRGVRDAQISEPTLRDVGGVKRYALCVRYNARKSTGKYEGAKDRLIVFLAGRLDTMIDVKDDECKEAKYQPFTELTRL
jgi:hypothetical protein